MNEKLLRIYLQDHLAGATGGLEFAKRAAGSNRGTEYGEFLEGFRDELVEERETLIGIMEAFGFGGDRLKNAGGWVAEKAGRLKLNGSFFSYSPLSRVVEVEGLTVAVRGKLSMWENLRMLAPGEPRLSESKLEALVLQAQAQLEGLGQLRAKAAREAFAGDAG